jgi:hypothetical protein
LLIEKHWGDAEMNDDEMIRIVKELGSDIKLLSDFFAKMCLFIGLSGGVDKFNCDFETNQSKDGTSYKGSFKFRKVK